jgi:hypothetical protein
MAQTIPTFAKVQSLARRRAERMVVSQFAGRSGKTVELSLDRAAEGGGPHVSIFQNSDTTERTGKIVFGASYSILASSVGFRPS